MEVFVYTEEHIKALYDFAINVQPRDNKNIIHCTLLKSEICWQY